MTNSKSQLSLHPKMGMGADKLGVTNETRNENETAFHLGYWAFFWGQNCIQSCLLSDISTLFFFSLGGFGIRFSPVFRWERKRL